MDSLQARSKGVWGRDSKADGMVTAGLKSALGAAKGRMGAAETSFII